MLIGLFALLAGAARGADNDAGNEFFEKRIRPILVERCYECHSASAKKLQGGLYLDHRDGIRKGGDSGPAVVPGDVARSLLISALRHESFEMPPDSKLPDEVIADFVKWVELGAADPRVALPGKKSPGDRGDDGEPQGQHWSFQPLAKPPLPAVRHPQWPRSEIDRFILAKLEQRGLEPAEDADRRTLIRRAYFDLVGLPPPPHEVAAFVSDDGPNTFAEVVDRLLASPHFGERWGRHWLDVARYAESSGGGRTQLFRHAWRYRDYVIRSFNNDKPFDQFIAEQIAGDLMPHQSLAQRADQLTALGFLVLGPTNYELQDKELLRMEVVDEQIDTLGRAVLGLTIGCARCHDHKFDPIPTTDYYALAGIFRSTKTLTPGNVSGWVERELPVDPQQQRELDAYRAEVQPLQQQLADRNAELKALRQRLGSSAALERLGGIVVDDEQAKLAGEWSSSKSNPVFVGAGYRYAGRGTAEARFEPSIPRAGRYEVRLAYNAHPNRSTRAVVTISHAGGQETRYVNQRQKPEIDGLFVSLGQYDFQRDGTASVAISCHEADGFVVADAVQLISVDPLQAKDTTTSSVANGEPTDDDAMLTRQIAAAETQVKQLKRRLEQLGGQAPPSPPSVMSVRDEDETGDYSICIRGNVHQLGATVPRGFLSVLGDSQPAAISPSQSGRRELAQWLVSSRNPLAARVLVNRIWHHLFGAGLVRTADNLGVTGEPPSHPELLDYLALQCLENQWSIKQLIREIMLSRTYQLSSAVSAAAGRADPENRLLSHVNRRRLDAESIRDAILVFSDQIDLRGGGSVIPEKLQSEFDYEFRGTQRSVYVPVFRNTLLDLFEVFDFADPNLVVGCRNTSVRPTQALLLMNSPFVMEQARHAAERLRNQPGLNEVERIELAFRLALARPPTPQELEMTRRYLPDASAAKGAPSSLDAWTAVCQSLVATIDFRYVD